MPVVIAAEKIVVGQTVWMWDNFPRTIDSEDGAPRRVRVAALLKSKPIPGIGTIRVEWGDFPMGAGGSAWVFPKQLFESELELLRARVKR